MYLKIALLLAGFNLLSALSFNMELKVLTNNFFENLQGDPVLMVDNGISDHSKWFIEKQIDNYMNLVTHNEISSIKKKRSLLDKFTKNIRGTYLLSGITPSATIPVRFPVDITLFFQNSEWYAAALESLNIKEDANNLVIFRYSNQKFNEEARFPVRKGVKLTTVSLENTTLIAVAENDTSKHTFHEKSGIYQFSSSGLVKIQSIDMDYASDIVMWKMHNEIYMSVGQFMSNKTGNILYELEIPIYKWLGKHFDVVQSIKGAGVKKITPFTVNHLNFLAIANFKNDEGSTKVYSEIYKYDYHLEKYELHQRILTRACTDIKFFNFFQNNRPNKDSFLIVANSFEEDSDGNINYETDSIVYKFIENYFIPFQSLQMYAIEDWLPVEGLNKEFVLFATCRFDGLKSLQYDGWAFREVPQKINELLKGRGIKSIRATLFNNTPHIVVVNKNNNGNAANLFKLEFTYHNTLNEIYDEMITWCDEGLGKIEALSSEDYFEAILGKPQRADIDEEIEEATTEEFHILNNEIEEINSKIDSLNIKLQQLYVNDLTLEKIDRNITADVIIFNNSTFIQNLIAPKINNFETDKLNENVLDINNGFQLGEINLSSVMIEGSVTPKIINGRNGSTLIHRSDDLNLDLLTVRGNLVALEGVEIKGKLNGITVDDQNLLLSVGDQYLSEPLALNSVKIDRMIAKSLNGKNMATVQLWNDDNISIDRIKNLKVKNLTIGGYINDVDIPTLNKYALKKSGDQTVTSDYIFDVLEGDNLEVEGEISGKRLSDLIPIDAGYYSINQDMIFKNNLTVNNLKVLDFLNGIDVKDEKLDVLLKDHSEEQEISGEKIFDDLIIYNAIYLQGNIKSEELEKMNPMVTVEEELVLEGNRTITGNVEVENVAKIGDMMTPDGTYSLTKLQREGVKLTDTEIRPRLHFIQQLNVDEIFVDTINDQDPASFVVTGEDETQIIQGSKIFQGDLDIVGMTNAFKINNVNVEELENKVMKIDGNQTIIGKHHIKHVVVDKMLSNGTRFGTNAWGDVITINRNQTVIIERNFKIDTLHTNSITVQGLVNDLDFDKIIKDTVTKDSNSIIVGLKFFENLTVSDLNVQNGVSDKIFSEENEMRIKGPLKIKEIQIKNLYFENKLNGVDKASFGKYEIDENDRRIVDGDYTFESIIVYGDVFIASNKINNVQINDLADNTVKIDEPFEFDMATFETEVVSTNPVLLEGHVENLDLDNVILSDLASEQTILDDKIFRNNLTINGSVSIDGFINDIDIIKFCKFAMAEIDSKNLIVDGCAFFVKGPDVKKINNIDVDNIWNNAWFNDKDTTLTDYVEFGNIIFKNDIDVQGFVDNVSLKLLSENYFSKSKNQNITATFTFQNDLIFESEVSVPEITLSGDVNDINLDTFVRTALLNDCDQVFETVLYLENCNIKNLTGEFSVNDMNVEQDVMRYDKINMVTGAKFFENLNVDYLKLEKNIKIQDVNVLDWLKNSVLKDTTFNITGTKSFKNARFANGFQLIGTLNDQKFDEDNIMLKNMPQVITGNKTIFTDILDPVSFKAIKLKGLLNEIDISDLINNQAYKNEDNSFKTGLNLYNDITTNNLIVRKLYQGINITELITNVTNLGALNNLLEQYKKLLVISHKLGASIMAQAYFVHHYKIIQTMPLITNSKKILSADGAASLGTLVTDESGVKMDLYGWHDQEGLFIQDASIKFGSQRLDYVDQVLMGRYLYIENDGIGHFVHITNSQSENIWEIPTNATKSTTSFLAPPTHEICTLFVYFNCAPKIYCEGENAIKLMQILDPLRAYEASSINIKGTLYLIVINEATDGVESHIHLWLLNNQTNSFEIHQSLFEAEPKSIATVHHNGFYYLAIASGHLQNAMYSGRVELKRFDESAQRFLPFQSLELDAPIQVEFSILSSDELLLYVLTDNPTEPLLVYRYEGIAGFRLSVLGSTLPQIRYINQFVGAANQHLIVAQSYDEIYVIQAIFKGEKIVDG